MKKNLIGFVLGATVLLLAGCGSGNGTTTSSGVKNETSSTNTTQLQKTNNTDAANIPATPVEVDPATLPKATGNPDSAVNAIIDGADKEKAQATSDSADATSAVDSSADTNNLNNTYDQNNL
jgi:hypothetical protein